MHLDHPSIDRTPSAGIPSGRLEPIDINLAILVNRTITIPKRIAVDREFISPLLLDHAPIGLARNVRNSFSSWRIYAASAPKAKETRKKQSTAKMLCLHAQLTSIHTAWQKRAEKIHGHVWQDPMLPSLSKQVTRRPFVRSPSGTPALLAT